MKSWTLVACLLASVLSACAAVSTNSSASIADALSVAPTNAYPLHIVTCHDDVDVDALLAEHQVQLQSPKHKLAKLKMFFVPPDAALIQRLKADPRVLAVEADGPVGFAGQWIVGQTIVGQYTADGLLRLGIPQFPITRLNGIPEPLDVDVAVLDSGVGPHSDLNIYTNFSVYAENANDLNGHGTTVAGVIGALDNGFGVVGVAPGVRIWNVQVSQLGGGHLDRLDKWNRLCLATR